MRVHHLNCGSFSSALIGRLVCHVLACETDAGIVLVDSGFGLADVADPTGRVGRYANRMGARFRESETAVRRLEKLGLNPADVTHIVATHLDFDHIGGVADFPNATLHTTAAERVASEGRSSFREKVRYRPAQLTPQPTLHTYSGPGESVLGFSDTYPIAGVGDRIVLVPMPGHTRGHAAVAVDTGEKGWLLHAGDAFYHRSTVAAPGQVSPGTEGRALRVMEELIAVDRSKIRGNHRRLRQLNNQVAPRVRVLSAHDPTLFEELAGERG
ncbi:MBL fold metallo-hydrolase [Rhodococcus sp. ACPA1]|uniref:MBL fold metallo-hydrolase n=1 Tax=Rhodococcus sp. ACPA1 TaxID=2028572 RepID=UPI000BB12EAF|nr:MBL fold metallo-hydrolase [Rhodococcus sp. ACPA1]PBC55642.1 MBL fold hydrolase [Rhodococcus sp. ACPA1]